MSLNSKHTNINRVSQIYWRSMQETVTAPLQVTKSGGLMASTYQVSDRQTLSQHLSVVCLTVKRLPDVKV